MLKNSDTFVRQSVDIFSWIKPTNYADLIIPNSYHKFHAITYEARNIDVEVFETGPRISSIEGVCLVRTCPEEERVSF